MFGILYLLECTSIKIKLMYFYYFETGFAYNQLST